MIGGVVKQNTLHACSGGVNRLKTALTDFKVNGLVQVLRTLANIFDVRYNDDDDNRGIVADLDSPDDTRFSKCLREAALTMAPLNVAPTSLISPTNNSQPPADRNKWDRATISIAKYY